MGQDRLNDLMLSNVHKERKKLSLPKVANEFAAQNERRKTDFCNDNFEESIAE